MMIHFPIGILSTSFRWLQNSEISHQPINSSLTFLRFDFLGLKLNFSVIILEHKRSALSSFQSNRRIEQQEEFLIDHFSNLWSGKPGIRLSGNNLFVWSNNNLNELSLILFRFLFFLFFSRLNFSFDPRLLKPFSFLSVKIRPPF